MAVDVREPHLSGVDQLRSAYQAKAAAELADADAIAGVPAPGATGRAGLSVGPRIAFVVGTTADGSSGGLLDERVADAVTKAADALGADDAVFTLVTRPPAASASTDDRASRVRLAIEAVDPPVVIALDREAADDLAAAFGFDELRPGHPVRAFGRAIGSAGDFAVSLDDPKAKARSWAAMKDVAALGGLHAKGRPKAPQDSASESGSGGRAESV
jgi:hypothetical protein